MRFVPRDVAEVASRVCLDRLLTRIRAELPAAVAAHCPFRDPAHVKAVWTAEVDRIVSETLAEALEAIDAFSVDGE